MRSMRYLVLDIYFHLIDLDQSSENDLINFDREAILFDHAVTIHLIQLYCSMTQGHYYEEAGFKDVKPDKIGLFKLLILLELFSPKSASEFWQLSDLF
ncbi:MAG: hypothetical protein EZS28_003403 [Streblomastix strix]|uniref:Uncharacterized protein n=1 Tax=Streblomastix strix TaxID=222440 RepID=A0A5J4X1H6_9EUKA|nr:MAG: hypothetical protein EZS28_003403 [Streblomastix strix]